MAMPNIRRYEREIKLFVLGCVYATLIAPIIVGARYLFPFVFPKAVYFQGLVELALIFYIALLAIDRQYLPRRNVIFWGIVAYVAAIALSTAFGVDQSFSFWSKAERMDGLFQYLHLLAYFVILTGVVRSESEWLRLLKAAMAGGVVIGFVSLISKFYPEIWNFGNQGRLGGTFGNPAFLATYYVVLIFFAFTFMLRERSRGAKVLYGFLFAFFFLLLFLSGTRGGYIGFVAGIVTLAAALMANDWKRWGKVAAAILGAFVLMLAVIYFGRHTLPQKSEFLRDRVYSINRIPETRQIVWQIAANAFRARPVFGWGQENFIYAFNTHFEPEIHTYELTLFDRAHNKVFDLLAMNGIPGLASYLFLFAGLAFSMIGVMRRRIVNTIWPCGFFALTAAYLVQNLVLFEMPTSGLVLFFFAAFMSWMTSEVREEAERARLAQLKEKSAKPVRAASRPLFPQWIVWPAALVILFTFVVGIWLPMGASRGVVATAIALSNQNVAPEARAADALAIYRGTRGKTSTFLDREFDMAVARRMRDAFPSPQQFLAQNQDLRAFAEEVTKNLERDFEKHPLDYDALMEIGNMYFLMQAANPEYAAKTFGAFDRARNLAPRREDAYQQLAMWYLSAGDFAKSDEALDILLSLNSKVGRFWWFRAVYEATVNNPQGVDEALANGLRYGFNWRSLGNMSYLASTFERHGNTKEALRYFGIITEELATSSFDIAIQAFEKALSIASGSRLREEGGVVKGRFLELAPDKQARIEELAGKYGF